MIRMDAMTMTVRRNGVRRSWPASRSVRASRIATLSAASATIPPWSVKTVTGFPYVTTISAIVISTR